MLKEEGVGARPITFKEYHDRLSRRREDLITQPFPVTKPKRRQRGGKLVKIKSRIRALKAQMTGYDNGQAPLPYQKASEIWKLICELQEEEAALRGKMGIESKVANAKVT